MYGRLPDDGLYPRMESSLTAVAPHQGQVQNNFSELTPSKSSKQQFFSAN
jgi:hypothetical protein